jgi:hypothetical protein
MAETSDTRFLNVCRRHLDIYKADALWNPSNSLLALTKMEAQLNGGYPVAADVWAKVAPQQVKINQRQEVYAKIAPLVRASRRYLKSSGASELEIADANTIINKILGQRAVAKTKINPNQPAATAEKSNSVAHLSYDSRLGNLSALREFYTNVSAYQPNETDLKTNGINTLAAECQSATNSVSAGFVTLLNAWNLRDAKLYNEKDSILEVFRDAKEYYKSLYVANTPQYRAITARDMTLDNNSRKSK